MTKKDCKNLKHEYFACLFVHTFEGSYPHIHCTEIKKELSKCLKHNTQTKN